MPEMSTPPHTPTHLILHIHSSLLTVSSISFGSKLISSICVIHRPLVATCVLSFEFHRGSCTDMPFVSLHPPPGPARSPLFRTLVDACLCGPCFRLRIRNEGILGYLPALGSAAAILPLTVVLFSSSFGVSVTALFLTYLTGECWLGPGMALLQVIFSGFFSRGGSLVAGRIGAG